MITNLSRTIVVAFGLAAVVGACGGGNNNSTPANDSGTGTNDTWQPPVDSGHVTDSGTTTMSDATAEAEGGMDHGAPSTTYPAFLPDVGTIQSNNGFVMNAPVIVPITWNADGSQTVFQNFADEIGATSYWHATTSEYGVGPATSGMANHVSLMTAPPASISDTDLQTMVANNAGAMNGWPAPTPNTIYAFFLAPQTSLNLNMGGMSSEGDAASGDACANGVGGYHSQVTVGSVTTSYAVVAACNFGGSATMAQQTTESMSHELIEAATDPQPNGTDDAGAPVAGWVGFDTDHFAYNWFFEFSNTEVGDACEVSADNFYEEKETSPAFDAFVQRTWSNKPGPMGHNPCVPAPSPSTTAYFNVAVLNLSEVTLTLPPQLTGATGNTNQQVKGVHIPVGKSAVVELGFFSDGPTSGPWTLSWHQGSPFNPNVATYLNATIDKTTGVNGEKAYVTVTPTSAGKLAGELLWIESTLGTAKHMMPIVISSYESD